MSKVYAVNTASAQKANINREEYAALYEFSIRDPETFWSEQAKKYVDWFTPWQNVMDGDLQEGNIRWFHDATLNVCYNCLDRHLPEHKDNTAILWEGDEPHENEKITFQTLHEKVCQLANGLKSLGVKKGHRVCIYLPMIPQAAIAMLACARIGAVHSVVFAGFSAHALRERLIDADCSVLITAKEGRRGGKTIPLKDNVEHALQKCPCIQQVIMVDSPDKTYLDCKTLMDSMPKDCPAEPMQAEDPLFILYTSGSTGKPKGVLHTTAGYLLYTTMTFKQVFDYQPSDVYWCTADVGWVTGHSYLIYGPLSNAATTLMFASTPNYPDASRIWQVVDKHQVTILYTAPTAIRALMRDGDDYVKKTSRKTLRLLGTVGEPINPEVWEWYYHMVGEGRCPVVDTWWQTETGGIMISPLPGATELKPGSATLPMLGIEPALLDEQDKEIQGPGTGKLVIKKPWPSIMRTVYGDHKRFLETYLKPAAGYYFTGDKANRDEDGFYWLAGRLDDVINVSGHRLGTAEIESAIVSHKAVAEAAVVSFPHDIKGEAIYAFVTPITGITVDDNLMGEIKARVKHVIGSIAVPDIIQFTSDLPKTRSGKIMRRILRNIAHGELQDFGDTSTLADPTIVDALIAQKPALK